MQLGSNPTAGQCPTDAAKGIRPTPVVGPWVLLGLWQLECKLDRIGRLMIRKGQVANHLPFCLEAVFGDHISGAGDLVCRSRILSGSRDHIRDPDRQAKPWRKKTAGR